MGKEAKQTNMWKQKQNKQDKIKLGFLGSSLRTQEQAWMHTQDYMYASSCPETLKTQPSLKH